MSLDNIAPDVDIEKELAAEAGKTQETPEAAPVEAPKEEVKAEEKPEKLVPLAALHESRMKEREARQRAEQLERDAQERFKKLEERLHKLANPEPKVPTFEEDPANHLRHQVKAVRDEVEPLRKQTEEYQRAIQMQQATAELARATSVAEQQFVKEKPDYLEAVAYLKGIVDKNLQLMGVEDPAARAKAVYEQSLGTAYQAIRQGRNPAQVVYELARNYGYQAKGQSVEKKLETIEKGQKATPSMPSGGKKETPLSLSALEQMDDDEFNKLIDDPVQWKKLISQ